MIPHVRATLVLPFILLIVVVVAVATTLVVNRLTAAPDKVLVRVTYGPTVISTQVVPLR